MGEGVQVLDRYAAEIVGRQTTDSFEIKDWSEEQFIGKHGDTKICRRFILSVGEQPLQTFWHKVHMTTNRNDTKYRKKLTIEARPFGVGDELGARYLLTQSWQGHVCSVFIHLDRAYGKGDEVPVQLNIYWPEFTKNLIDEKGVEPTEWEFHRKVGRIKVSMYFDKSLKIRDALRITPMQDPPKVALKKLDDGSRRIDFEYENPPQEKSIGFHVELKSP